MGTFYSFIDAYDEAIKDDPIKCSEQYNRTADLASVRREFRDFLNTLCIDSQFMKDPEKYPPLVDFTNYDTGDDREKRCLYMFEVSPDSDGPPEDNPKHEEYYEDHQAGQEIEYGPFDHVAKFNNPSEWYNIVKRSPYSFDEQSFYLAVDFIKNWKTPKYKEMRRGHFSKKYSSDYQNIIFAVSSNMQAHGYDADDVFQQICRFWDNIVEKSSCSIFDFLYMSSLLQLDPKTQKRLHPTSLLEQHDLIYLDHMIVDDWNKFWEKWIEYLPKVSTLRRADIYRCEEQIKLIEGNVGPIEKILFKGDRAQPKTDTVDTDSILDLRKQKIFDNLYISQLSNDLGYLHSEITHSRLDFPNLPSPISSQELCERIIRTEED